MLTVDYDRLGLARDDVVLDLGCGFGRHAFETARRGAHVVACDTDLGALHDVAATMAGLRHDGDIAVSTSEAAGDARHLPFADGAFDRVIASEVLEHVPDDHGALGELARVLRPGGMLAATVPAFLPERICWALSDDYHAPAQPGGHLRIYTLPELQALLRGVGLDPVDHHRVHALHSPYWWLKCAVGIDNDDNPLVRQYLRFLTWDIVEGPTLTRVAERALAPVLGKSMVVYARKPDEANR